MLLFQKTLSRVAAPISVAANLILILLIIFKSPAQMGNYKYLLIGLSIFEMSYAVLDVVSETTVLSIKKSFVVVVPYKDRSFGQETAMDINLIYCGFFGFSMGMFVVIFAYRSFLTTGNTILRKFEGFKIISWFAYPLFYAIVWILVAWGPLASFPEMDIVVRPFLLDELNMTVDEVAYTGRLFYSTIDNSLRYSAILTGVLQWVLTASSLFLVIFFGLRCYFHYGKLVQLTDVQSIRLRQLQNQLFLALVCQATVPLILMHIPVTILYTCCVLNIVFNPFSVATTIALFPAIDPLPTIFIVKNYRVALFEFVCPSCLCWSETLKHMGSNRITSYRSNTVNALSM
ncbi:G-protein coupled receptor str-217 [Caenorhabditis elegans]|uniref:G-protein coupled receptor str-217 n=1 Tax=Caenorhabditis elegans TaxID=6239 RepID=ST217_CAEEL|nr:G-protein coupled receptor str-217 [Caenorhabditis elegans]Q9XX85.2 RecName: Full=G-protein coupled receptor str-217 [Caenorhabditis elegans]CAA20950.2 G-protein coupled receptor str-217 [Caenorhabditis elegans]|eukprot:NP_507300.1 Seven TM Receptor [Caenorhabditis elegans]